MQTLVWQKRANQPLSAGGDLLSREFGPSHLRGGPVRRRRAWESGLGRVWIASLITPGHGNQQAAGAENMLDWCFVWEPESCSAGQDGDPQWEGIEVSPTLSATKASSSLYKGDKEHGSYFSVCTRQIWVTEGVVQLACCELIESVTDRIR